MDEPTRRFLETQSVAHLATADATGVPHVVPICFALIGQTLYVAMTRAKDRLTLTWCKERGGKPSGGTMFLDEMGLTDTTGRS